MTLSPGFPLLRPPMTRPLTFTTTAQVRDSLIQRREIALLDVREEDPHAHGHPLFAANLPASRIEADAYARLPRRDVPIVVLDDDGGDEGDSEARTAARRLAGRGPLVRCGCFPDRH